MKRTRKISIQCKEEGSTVELDVNPQEVRITYAQMYKKTELVGGEHVQVGARRRREITLSTFLPAAGSPFQRGGLSQKQIWEKLINWQMKRKVLCLHIVSYTKMDCYLVSMTRTAVEGDADMAVEFVFLEKDDIGTVAIADTAVETAAEKAAKAVSGKTHVLKNGETLWGLAVRYYGNGARWPEISAANGDIDPRLLGGPACPLGKELLIP